MLFTGSSDTALGLPVIPVCEHPFIFVVFPRDDRRRVRLLVVAPHLGKDLAVGDADTYCYPYLLPDAGSQFIRKRPRRLSQTRDSLRHVKKGLVDRGGLHVLRVATL